MPTPQGAVELALEKSLFGRFTTKERILAIATTTQKIMNNNPERIGWLAVNTGNIEITFSLSSALVAQKGIIVAQLGDTLNTTYLEDGQFPTHEVYAIASAVGGEIYLTEFIRIN